MNGYHALCQPSTTARGGRRLASLASIATTFGLMWATAAQAQEAPSLLAPHLDRLYASNFENLPKVTIEEGWPIPSTTVPDRNLGKLTIQYQGGNSLERSAEIIQDPTASAMNLVLQYKISEPNVRNVRGIPERGRIQLNAYSARCIREMAISVRVMFLPEMAVLKDYWSQFDWLTIAEWWNNNDWGTEGSPFRVSINLTKPGAARGGEVYFQASGQAKGVGEKNWNIDVWKEINTDFSVPFGRWITIEYYYKEGGREAGRFAMNVAVDGGPMVRIFDVKNYTHAPFDRRPNGLTQMNPLKLYSSADLINAAKSLGGGVRMLWDDVDIRGNQLTAGCL